MAAEKKGMLRSLFGAIFGRKKVTLKELEEKLRKASYQVRQAVGKMDFQVRKVKPRFDAAVREGVKAAASGDAASMQSAGLKLRMAAFLTSRMQAHRAKLLKAETWIEGKIGDVEVGKIFGPVAAVVGEITDNKEMQDMLMDVATETESMMSDVTRDLELDMAKAEEPTVGDFELGPVMSAFREMADAVKTGNSKRLEELKGKLPAVVSEGLQVSTDGFAL